VIGALTAAAATGQLIFLPGLSWMALHHGWKSVSIVVGSSALIMVPFIFLFLKESPKHINQFPFGADHSYEHPTILKTNAAQLALNTLKESIPNRNFWYLVGSFFVCGLSTSGLIGTHLIAAGHDHGMSEVVGASLRALIGVFDVIGTICSGWLTDRIDPRKLLFFYYFFRGVSLFLLPSILFASVHPSTLVFVIFYGLDWVATVPPTIVLCKTVVGPERGTVVYGWVFAAHQVGGAIAAYGAALARVKFGDYSIAFYAAGILCVITSYFVLKIGREKSELV
jgi:sugar phosphate permease